MTVSKVMVLDDVPRDLREGKSFYDERESGVGDYFWDSIIADIESLVLYAGIHPREQGLHRMLSRRFPYAVYYEISDNVAYVVAVLPMRRDPEWRQHILGRRDSKV